MLLLGAMDLVAAVMLLCAPRADLLAPGRVEHGSLQQMLGHTWLWLLAVEALEILDS